MGAFGGHGLCRRLERHLDPSSINPRAVIDSIRRRWGVDLSPTVDAEARATIEHLREQMGNSLDLLSEQLYQSETHFFLELLQNADDNEYPASASPSLTVTLFADRATFQNNERGFNVEEVHALCGLGNSTKKRRKAAQIGEKGIGFKAVFQVSDCPEIRSGGFRFRFNRLAHGNLGLVIPEWLDEQTPSAAGTLITLPLKSGTFWRLKPEDLRPELLLFLRRLRHLVVKNQVHVWEVELHRDGTEPMVTVRRTQKSGNGRESHDHRFFVHRRVVAMDDVSERLRPDVRETEVVIAMPVDADGGASAGAPRDVFAFLPITKAGFTFVCHADFVLVTNREEVLRGRPWNDRLRNELGTGLADAIVASQSHGALGRNSLRFLTDPQGIPNEFFKQVLSVAIGHLKTARCVPLEDDGYGATVQRARSRRRVSLGCGFAAGRARP